MQTETTSPDNFYGDLAATYDVMIPFAKRLAKARQWAASQARGGVRSALDAGAGTGLHAIALALEGVRVVGLDLSAAMLDRARKRADELGAAVDWRVGSLTALDETLGDEERYDLVVCLGNTLPHLHQPAEIGLALTGFRRHLNPAGRLVIQTVNYSRVLREKRRILATTRSEDDIFVRFYDFLGDTRLRFNVLRLRAKAGDGPQLDHDLTSTELRPWRHDELTQALANAGFAPPSLAGDLDGTVFDPVTSNGLVVEAVPDA